MSYYSKKEWTHKGFEKSDNKNKKYAALLKNNETGKIKKIHFGYSPMPQYKDTTGLGEYSDMDHNDKDRRDRYEKRHKVYIKPGYYSAGYFSLNYLWS